MKQDLPDSSWKMLFSRMLSRGLNPKQALSASQKSSSSFQQEAFVRQLLKDVKRNRKNLSVPLKDISFIVLDSETTGFRPDQGDEIISIAAAKVSLQDTDPAFFSTYIRPSIDIPKTITELTGLSGEDVENAPKLEDVIHDFIEFISEGMIVGYHIAHDVLFLNDFLWKHYRLRLTQPVIEIRQVIDGLGLKGSFSSLDRALDFFAIKAENRHTALGDVKLTVRLWKTVLDRCFQRDIRTLHDLYVLLSDV